MISASWPMPESFNPPTSDSSYIQPEDIKQVVDLLYNQKQEIKNSHNFFVSPSEKELIISQFDSMINKLAKKMLINQLSSFKSTHVGGVDLDDVYSPKGKIPFPKHIQPSLFEGTKWEPYSEDEPF